jgi:hypothetical protein
MATLSTNLGNPPSLKLTHDNMLFWKGLVFSSLRCAGAFGLLDGSDAAPAKMLEARDDATKKVSMPNPDYATWVARDQFVQGWLNNSISPGILAYVLDTETTAETWATTSAMFKSASKAKVSHLRTALNNTKKKEMTVEQYISKMSGFRCELAAAEKIIGDEEMIGYITAGLNNTYNALVDRVDNTPGISLTDVKNQINPFDMRQTLLADLDNDTGPFISSANLGTRGWSSSRGCSPDRDRHGNWRRDDNRRRDDDRRRDDWRRDDRRDDVRYDDAHHDDRRDDRRRDDRRRDEPRRDDRRDNWHCIDRCDDRRRDEPCRNEGGRRHGRDRTPTPFVDARCQI